jgi:hypothetical protein
VRALLVELTRTDMRGTRRKITGRKSRGTWASSSAALAVATAPDEAINLQR